MYEVQECAYIGAMEFHCVEIALQSYGERGQQNLKAFIKETG